MKGGYADTPKLVPGAMSSRNTGIERPVFALNDIDEIHSPRIPVGFWNSNSNNSRNQ